MSELVVDEGQFASAPATAAALPLVEPATGVLHGAGVRTRTRDSWRRRLLAVADVAALLSAYGLLWVLAPPPGTWTEDLILLVVLPMWVVLNKVEGLYDRDASLIHQSTLNEVPQVTRSLILGAALLWLIGPLVPGVELHREQLLVWLSCAIVLTPALRYGARAAVRAHFAPEQVLIIGSGQVASLVAGKISAHPEYGAELVGFVDVGAVDTSEVGDLEHLGGIEDFEAICRQQAVDRVVIAFSSLAHEPLLDLIRMSKRLGLKVSVVPRLFEVIGHSVEIDQVEGMTLLGLRSLTLSRSTLLLKRAVDVVGASIGLVLCAPVLAVCAVAIKLDTRGPVFFAQPRIGRREKTFRMWKLRTMVVGADEMKAGLEHLNEMAGGPMFKIAADPRVTRVGGFLRRTSIDELPQLWNVMRGDMSLVGPRPLVPCEDHHVVGWHRARLDLTPGLTGPWQVLGRNAIPFHEMIKLDYLYVAEWSLWNDIKLILRTLPAMVGRRGA